MLFADSVRQYAEWQRTAFIVQHVRASAGEKHPPSVESLIGEPPKRVRAKPKEETADEWV
jgi:hypothetical protein